MAGVIIFLNVLWDTSYGLIIGHKTYVRGDLLFALTIYYTLWCFKRYKIVAFWENTQACPWWNTTILNSITNFYQKKFVCMLFIFEEIDSIQDTGIMAQWSFFFIPLQCNPLSNASLNCCLDMPKRRST